MAIGPASLLRHTTASLMCLSGLGQIAALWLRELTGTALADGLLGTVYLITAIGLFGHSRFSLFIAILIPATASAVLLYTMPTPEQIYKLRIATDTAIILLSVIVLWQARHRPSV
jgi:hypothetical protein